MAKKVDATKGKLVRLIFIYTIPIILSTILQNLFNIADKAVLGNWAGSDAVASIGATTTISGLIINGALGLSTGTAIILARYVGQKDNEKIKKTVDTALITATLIGIVLAFAGVLLTPTFLTLTNCPSECYDGAVIYMRICLAGAPASLLYNYSSAILRTLGDTQKPLVYITVAGGVNVVLNIILCIFLPQKVMAVAIATVVSKIVSVVLVLRRLNRFEEGFKLEIKKMRFDLSTFWQILRFGIPASISTLMYPLANLQIVSEKNSFGVDAIAGCSAAESIHTIICAFASGFAVATTTFMGQNIGARNPDRVKKSFWYTLSFNLLISGSLGILFCLTGRFWLGIIVGRSATVAIEYGLIRMFYVTFFVFIYAANQTLSHALQAFGYPMFTSISNIAFTLGFRTVWMQFIYPHSPTFSNLMLCFTVSWTLNMLLYSVFFTFVYIRYTKKGICKKI